MHITTENKQFETDVLRGLSASPKYLQSKYFYDATGDELFRAIMDSPDYYLSRCELEVLSNQAGDIIDACLAQTPALDVIELGAGDASKSIYLLQALQARQPDLVYLPIDISANVIALLQDTLPQRLPGLKLQPLEGEYLPMLEQAAGFRKRPRLVLFLGSNIGNIPLEQNEAFLKSIRQRLQPGDLFLAGFDLQKDPALILKAYDDEAGVTRQFNLNLLERINRELDAGFDVDQFYHYPVYDPGSGACKSYLISRIRQTVHVAGQPISFAAHEPVFMEVSQKYRPAMTDALALASGFKPLHHFYDSRQWFLDALWECV